MHGNFQDLTTRRANATRLEKGTVEQEVPPLAPPKATIYLLNDNVANVDFCLEFQALS